jgi:hypothetical protein
MDVGNAHQIFDALPNAYGEPTINEWMANRFDIFFTKWKNQQFRQPQFYKRSVVQTLFYVRSNVKTNSFGGTQAFPHRHVHG